MKPFRATFVLAFTSLVACSPPTEPIDAGGDVSTDHTAPTDSTDVPADGDASCPTSNMAAFAAGTSCPIEGQVCRYGYTRVECGGRTLTCTGGNWAEEHTDPQPACFSDGGTPDGGTPCGSQTCDPTQFCIHPCSGIDAGASSPPSCGTPSSCPSGMGHAIGADYYCEGCA